MTGSDVAYKPFHNQLVKPAFEDFLHTLAVAAMEKLSSPACRAADQLTRVSITADSAPELTPLRSAYDSREPALFSRKDGEIYRLRWQVEILFKEMCVSRRAWKVAHDKRIVGARDHLVKRDSDLAEAVLVALFGARRRRLFDSSLRRSLAH